MAATDPQDEPINEGLERLASIAEGEDKAPDPEQEQEPAKGELVTSPEIQEEAIDHMAVGGISFLAWLVKMIWDVEHDEATKDKGVKKLKPCLQPDILPDWAIYLFGRYGPFVVFGAFLVAAGASTYAIVQKRKAKAKKQDQDDEGPAIAEPVPDFGAQTPGSFSTAGGSV